MSAIEQTADQGTSNYDAVIRLADDLKVQIELITTILYESAQDQDVRQAALRIASNAGQLWSAVSRLAGSMGVESVVDIETRINAAVHALEPVLVGLETLRETAPEIMADLSRSGTLQQFAIAIQEWVEVLNQARALIQGGNPSAAASIRSVLTSLEQWSAQLKVAWETVSETLPEVLDRGAVQASVNRLGETLLAWSSVAREARSLLGDCGGGNGALAAHEIIGAIREAQLDMKGQSGRRGGILAFLSFLFSGRTLFVLRYAVAIMYRVLRTIDQPGSTRKSS
ncbi:hypothetical protein BJI67_15520 [Acidihalobacter aeolianus]|uniref:Uncharacterized protein n=1 Tax=Acidihalobacter aeolianus TaxID=2792603 RepID=A0A1D8KBD6_9GAMM|nr:hypothetical protein [Acidihalobacter aeolianus]AOV18283.1 hypothetical protein BJI67_15520 [Acidihalobacter aeolianus]